MTREEAKELFKKASDIAGNYLEHVEIVSMHNIDIVLSEIYNEHEAQLKAKDKRIRELEEAMKQRTCEGCFCWDSVELSVLKTISYCRFLNIGTINNFCCNKWEAKGE